MGWSEPDNGDLLREAEAAKFDLLIIRDKNLRPSAESYRETAGYS